MNGGASTSLCSAIVNSGFTHFRRELGGPRGALTGDQKGQDAIQEGEAEREGRRGEEWALPATGLAWIEGKEHADIVV